MNRFRYWLAKQISAISWAKKTFFSREWQKRLAEFREEIAEDRARLRALGEKETPK